MLQFVDSIHMYIYTCLYNLEFCRVKLYDEKKVRMVVFFSRNYLPFFILLGVHVLNHDNFPPQILRNAAIPKLSHLIFCVLFLHSIPRTDGNIVNEFCYRSSMSQKVINKFVSFDINTYEMSCFKNRL
jgi:hypothetical protein